MSEELEVKKKTGRPPGALNQATNSVARRYNVLRELSNLKFDPLVQMVKIAKATYPFCDVEMAIRVKATADILDRVCPKLKQVQIKEDPDAINKTEEFREEMKKLLAINKKEY